MTPRTSPHRTTLFSLIPCLSPSALQQASACMVCLDCEIQARDYHNLVKVSQKKQLFNFAVESTGALRPEVIVLRAVEVLRRKLKDVRAHLRDAEKAMEQ